MGASALPGCVTCSDHFASGFPCRRHEGSGQLIPGVCLPRPGLMSTLPARFLFTITPEPSLAPHCLPSTASRPTPGPHKPPGFPAASPAAAMCHWSSSHTTSPSPRLLVSPPSPGWRPTRVATILSLGAVACGAGLPYLPLVSVYLQQCCTLMARAKQHAPRQPGRGGRGLGRQAEVREGRQRWAALRLLAPPS